MFQGGLGEAISAGITYHVSKKEGPTLFQIQISIGTRLQSRLPGCCRRQFGVQAHCGCVDAWTSLKQSRARIQIFNILFLYNFAALLADPIHSIDQPVLVMLVSEINNILINSFLFKLNSLSVIKWKLIYLIFNLLLLAFLYANS